MENLLAKLVKKSFNYRLVGPILWYFHRGSYLPCVPEKKKGPGDAKACP